MSVTTPRRPQKRSNQLDRVETWIDIPFVKGVTDTKSGDIVLSGYASTFGLDRDGEMVARDAFDKSLSDYLSKNPMVLWQHNMDWPIGAATAGRTDDTGLYLTATIPNPGPNAADWQKGAYTAIKTGVVRTFSIGGYMTRDVKAGPDGPVFYIVEVELFETSIVSIPANADSIFEAAMKAFKGERPALAPKAVTQMEQLLGFKELTDPELADMDPGAREERYGMLSALFERAYGVEPPAVDSWRQVDKARKAGANPLNVARAALLLGKAFYNPEPGLADRAGKAGRAISAANKTKLQEALASHDEIEKRMVNAAEEMKAAAQSHADAVSSIKDVIGEEEPDTNEDDSADEEDAQESRDEQPAKGADDVESKDVEVEHDSGPRRDARQEAEAEAEEAASIETTEDEDLMLAGADYTKDLLASAIYYKAAGLEVKGALPLATLPIADRDRAWDAGAAKRRVHSWAQGDPDSGSDGGAFDPSKLAKAYLWRDDGAASDQVTSYKFIVADIIDGALTYVPRGIFAAAGVVQGGRGGTADEVASAIKPAIAKLYGRMAQKFGDDDLRPPWDQ